LFFYFCVLPAAYLASFHVLVLRLLTDVLRQSMKEERNAVRHPGKRKRSNLHQRATATQHNRRGRESRHGSRATPTPGVALRINLRTEIRLFRDRRQLSFQGHREGRRKGIHSHHTRHGSPRAAPQRPAASRRHFMFWNRFPAMPPCRSAAARNCAHASTLIVPVPGRVPGCPQLCGGRWAAQL
jgi:hypothetical protein